MINTDFTYRLGTQLRGRRVRAGLTLSDIEQRCGVSAPRLSLIENGKVDARVGTIARVLDATGGTLADLDLKEPSVVSVESVLERRTANRRRLEAAGLPPSDPDARLDRRTRRGEDTSAERWLIASE
jgi:transcriptional regulator with XRE-family HTH domain